MSFNGAGVFTANSTGLPVVTGTTISSTMFNAFTSDVATGLSTCILKDGTQTATASVPFIQGLTAAIAASAIFGTTQKWYLFNDATYTYLTNAASGGQEGLRCSATETALMVGSSAVLTATSTAMATPDTFTAGNGVAIPAGGTDGQGLMYTATANFGVFFGSGAPTLSAAKGSLYLRSNGSTTNDRAYINTNGTTGWTALTTAS